MSVWAKMRRRVAKAKPDEMLWFLGLDPQLHQGMKEPSKAELETLKVTDPNVIAISGSDEHPILRASDDPEARVGGSVFLVSDDELTAADKYEVQDYARVEVPIASGGTAWAYVFSSPLLPAA